MGKKFEDVKKILGVFDEFNVEKTAHQICQLFPRSEDNPEGYEIKTKSGWNDDGTTLTYDEPKPDVGGQEETTFLPPNYISWGEHQNLLDAECQQKIDKLIEDMEGRGYV